MGPGPDPRPGLQPNLTLELNDFTLASPPRPAPSVDPACDPSGHFDVPAPANS